MNEVELEFLRGLKEDIQQVDKKLSSHVEECMTVNRKVDRHDTYFKICFAGLSSAWVALLAWWKH